MKLFIDIVMKQINLFNIVAWNYREKIGFPVCKKENFAGLQSHRNRGKSARASPTPHHILNEERSARFTAQPLSALVKRVATRCHRFPGGGGGRGYSTNFCVQPYPFICYFSRKRYSFRAEPSRIGHDREYPRGRLAASSLRPAEKSFKENLWDFLKKTNREFLERFLASFSLLNKLRVSAQIAIFFAC